MSSGPVLILGAHSDIGRAIARAFARAGRPVVLAARRPERLDRDAADIRIRFEVDVKIAALDVLDLPAHEAFIDALAPFPDTVVSVVGLAGDQSLSEADPSVAKLIMDTNYVAPALLIGEIAKTMAARGHGTIIAISSVAGERGRFSNYIYGSAKAGFTAFVSGLRARMSHRNVRVVTVKPGYVDTSATAGMKLPPILTASPDGVAQAVVRSETRGPTVIYVRKIWWLIMTIIKLLPERVFMRLRF